MKTESPGGKIILDAAAERLGAGSVCVCWETAGECRVSVYAGPSPDNPDKAVHAGSSDTGCLRIRDLDPVQRYYFFLAAGDDRMVVAERKVYMDGAVNFRDLGGYGTKSGKRVRWGRVFRSDGLARLSDQDLGRISQMGIRRVYDFRNLSETRGASDRLPEDGSVLRIHLPVSHGRFDFAEAVSRLKNGDKDWLTPDFMINGYISNLEKYAGTWASVIRDLAEYRGEPAVFHCTGGKDRTGTCAALILLCLGVAEETVIDDHQLSNIYIARLLPRLYRQMEKEGIDPDALFPYLTAPRQCIVAVIDYLIENYGSAENYLTERAGMSPDEIDRFRSGLLE